MESYDNLMTRIISDINCGRFDESGFDSLLNIKAIVDCINVVKVHSPNQNTTPASITIVKNAIATLRVKLKSRGLQ